MADRLLTPGEVAEIFAVSTRTVVRWAKTGILPVARFTLGGHRRFQESDVMALAEKEQNERRA